MNEEVKISRCIIRKPRLLSKVPMSDTSIWRWEKMGKFPKRIQLGECSVGWFEDEIDAWLEERSSERKLKGHAPSIGPGRKRAE